MIIRTFEDGDEAPVVALWRACGLVRSWNDPLADIARKKTVQPHWFLVGEVEHEIVATAMFGYDGHRGWVNYLGVAELHRGQGFARILMAHGEALLRGAGCPKLNLQVRSGNAQAMAFYRRLGYAADEAVCFGKRLIPDE